MRSLLITKSPPYPAHMGGNQRSWILLDALAQHGEADLFLLQGKADLPEAHWDILQREYRLVGNHPLAGRGECGAWRLLRPLSARTADAIASVFGRLSADYRPDPKLKAALLPILAAGSYDAVFIKGMKIAVKTGIPPEFPVVVDVDDIAQEWYRSLMLRSETAWWQRLLAWRRTRELERFTPEMYRQFPYIWVAKEHDRTFPGLEQAQVVGVPYYSPDGSLPVFQPSPADSRNILIVASYYHRPNLEGLDWFIKKVWPIVIEKQPDAVLVIVGAGLPDSRKKRWASIPGICIKGMVDVLSPEYAASAMTIAPIWTGSGMNLKVLESLIHSRAMVLTPYAVRGYESTLLAAHSIRTSPDAKSFAEECVRLLENPNLRDEIARRGHEIASAISSRHFRSAVDATVKMIAKKKQKT